MESTFAVITTRNEQDTIGNLIDGLKFQGIERICVVDESSADLTPNIARNRGATVIQPPIWLGIGKALMLGWERAIDEGAKTILQIDAGGAHNPSECQRFLNVLHYADIVVGSRFVDGSRYIGNPLRACASRLIASFCSARHGYDLTDWTSGYRAFTADVVRQLVDLSYRARMHGWHIEVLKHAVALNLKISQVPISYRGQRSAANAKIVLEVMNSAWSRHV